MKLKYLINIGVAALAALTLACTAQASAPKYAGTTSRQAIKYASLDTLKFLLTFGGMNARTAIVHAGAGKYGPATKTLCAGKPYWRVPVYVPGLPGKQPIYESQHYGRLDCSSSSPIFTH